MERYFKNSLQVFDGLVLDPTESFTLPRTRHVIPEGLRHLYESVALALGSTVLAPLCHINASVPSVHHTSAFSPSSRSECPCSFLGADYEPGDVVMTSAGVQ